MLECIYISGVACSMQFGFCLQLTFLAQVSSPGRLKAVMNHIDWDKGLPMDVLSLVAAGSDAMKAMRGVGIQPFSPS